MISPQAARTGAEPYFAPFQTFVLTAEWAIAVADVLRVVSLILGCMVAALYARMLLSKARRTVVMKAPGFGARSGAITLLTTTSCMFQFDRINDPVTVLLPLNLAGLTFAVVGLYRLPTRPPVDDEWLRRECR